MVEALNGNLNLPLLVHEDGFFGSGVLADGGEPVAEAAFGGEDAVLEAEALDVVGVARVTEIAQGLGAGPFVGDPPTDEQEDGDGIERLLTPGGGPAQELGQHRAQGVEVHQTQEQIEGGEMFPGSRVLQALPAQVDVMGAIVVLGGGRCVRWDRPDQRQAVLESGQAALGHEDRILGAGLDSGEAIGLRRERHVWWYGPNHRQAIF